MTAGPSLALREKNVRPWWFENGNGLTLTIRYGSRPLALKGASAPCWWVALQACRKFSSLSRKPPRMASSTPRWRLPSLLASQRSLAAKLHQWAYVFVIAPIYYLLSVSAKLKRKAAQA